jgi:hypothetical protein
VSRLCGQVLHSADAFTAEVPDLGWIVDELGWLMQKVVYPAAIRSGMCSNAGASSAQESPSRKVAGVDRARLQDGE